jgi:hypothetical protein
MIATKKYIKYLREKSFMKISAEAEKLILAKLGKSPCEDDEDAYEYTEQDIIEQIRQIIWENPEVR